MKLHVKQMRLVGLDMIDALTQMKQSGAKKLNLCMPKGDSHE